VPVTFPQGPVPPRRRRLNLSRSFTACMCSSRIARPVGTIELQQKELARNKANIIRQEASRENIALSCTSMASNTMNVMCEVDRARPNQFR
jgi:hypothetical protein